LASRFPAATARNTRARTSSKTRGAASAARPPGLTATTNNNQYPDSTPDKPYLTDVLIHDSAKFSKRSSLGATVDYRLTPHDRVSFSFQYAYFDAELSNRMLTFFVNRVAPEDLSTTFTRGEAGRGVMRLDNNGMRRKSGTTYMPTLSYRHDGPIWRAEAGIGLSHASNHYRDGSEGTFANSQGRRAGVTISFEDNLHLRPGRITVTDGATGAPVNPYDINNFVVLNTEQCGTGIFRSAAQCFRQYQARPNVGARARCAQSRFRPSRVRPRHSRFFTQLDLRRCRRTFHHHPGQWQ